MEDERKTKKQMIEELNELRQSVSELKGFAEEIKQTRIDQEKFTKAFLNNSIPAGITTLKEGRFVDISDSYLSLMGRKRDEVIGHTSIEIGFITQEQRKSFFHELNKSGRIDNFEMEVTTKGGALRHGLFNAVMMTLGNEKYLLTVMIDITDRKQALHELEVHQIELTMQNEELRRAQIEVEAVRARYFDLYDLAPVGYVTVSEKGFILEGNLTAASLLDMTRHDLLKQPLSRFILAEDVGIYYLLSKQLFKTGEPQKCELRMVSKDGTAFWAYLDATTTKNADGVSVSHVTINDITNRKQMDETLRESEARLHRIVENTRAGYFYIDRKGFYRHVNDAWLRLHGYDSPDEVIGQHFTLTQVEDGQDEAQKSVVRLLAGDAIPTGEFSRRCRDGSIQYHTFSASPVLQDGKVVGLEGFIIDVTEHKRTEEALHKSEQKYRQLVDVLREGIWAIDKDSKTTFVNDCMAEILGYTVEEMLGKHLFSFMDEQGVVICKCNLERRQQGIKEQHDFEFLRKDGSRAHMILEAAPIIDDAGIYQGAIAGVVDITERKRVEEALQESEEKYRSLFQNASIGIFHTLPEGKILEVNPAMSRMFGYVSPEEMIAAITNIGTQIYVDAERRPYIISAVMDSTDWVYSENRFRRKDGTIMTANLSVRKILKPDGTVACLEGFVDDITERKQTQAALEESEERFRRMFLTHDAIMLLIDQKTGSIRDANDAAAQFYGYSKERICKMTIQEINILPAEEVALQRTLALEQKRNYFIFPHLLANGEVKTVEVHSSPVAIQNDKLLFSIIHDITERKRIEAEKEKLEAQNRQLQKSESLGRMAAAIAHHFNNQLGVVMGNLELAMDKLPQDAEPFDILNAAMQGANKAAQMSGLMLMFLGQTSDKREPLDIAEACLRNQPIIRVAMPKNVVMENNLPSPGPVINANANQIQQVYTNLITNAREAIGDNKGTISLNVKTVSPEEISSFHRFPGDWQPKDNIYACVEVKDTGCGIEDKDIEKLFDPFFSTKFTGRGMGLAVVLGIVKAHGGVITTESKPGSGSTFRVFFPVSMEEVPRHSDNAFLTLAIEEGGTVLLVEDEEMMRIMVTSMLKRLGFSVIEAKDGVDAVEIFRQHKDEIRFVLSDLTMPRMDGWETLTALRKIKPGVPVILASGYDKAQVMAGDHPELPQAFLGKPYKLKGLSDAIGQVLGSTELSGMKEKAK